MKILLVGSCLTNLLSGSIMPPLSRLSGLDCRGRQKKKVQECGEQKIPNRNHRQGELFFLWFAILDNGFGPL